MVAHKIIGNLKQQHHRPAHAAGPGGSRQTDAGTEDKDRHHPQAGLDKGAQQGDPHAAHAPVKALHAVGKGGQQVEESHDGEIGAAQGHDVRLGGRDKQLHHRLFECQSSAADQQPVAAFQPQPPGQTPADAPPLARAPVLGDEGSDAAGDALFGGKGEIVHPAYGVEGSHGVHTQAVDGTLDQQFAYRLAGLLQCRHGAVAQSVGQQSPAGPHIPGREGQQGNAAVDIKDAEPGAHRLGHHGGEGGAEDAEAQQSDEDAVQQGVENGGKGQEF